MKQQNSKREFKAMIFWQYGQALTEFIVIALALIPLFLLFPLIGKYQDIAHSVQLASRYAAFEALNRNDASSTWKPEIQLANEVRSRFFGNSEIPIRTGEDARASMANQNPFWSNPKGEALIKDPQNDVKLSFGPSDGISHDEAFTRTADGISFPMHDLLDLRSRGIYTARVSVVLANLPSDLKSYEPFDRIDLKLIRSTSIVIDPWMAGDPGQAEFRFGDDPTIFPATALRFASAPVDATVSVIDLPGSLRAPKVGTLDFWRDTVPNDRLK